MWKLIEEENVVFERFEEEEQFVDGGLFWEEGSVTGVACDWSGVGHVT